MRAGRMGCRIGRRPGNDCDAPDRYVSSARGHRPAGGGIKQYVVVISIRAGWHRCGVADALRICLAQSRRARSQQERRLACQMVVAIGPLMRFVCGDVRNLIVSHQTDHGPAHRRYRALQRRRCLEINFREIFGIVRFSTFATKSPGEPTSSGCLGRSENCQSEVPDATLQRRQKQRNYSHVQSDRRGTRRMEAGAMACEAKALQRCFLDEALSIVAPRLSP